MRLYHQTAFTLIELVTVLVIVGILATTVFIRFTSNDADLQVAKNAVLAGLIFARETAMARSDGASTVTFVIATGGTEASIDVRVNDTSIDHIDQLYPLTLPSDVTITPADQQLLFTNLGETTQQTITLEDNGVSLVLNVSGVGYAY